MVPFFSIDLAPALHCAVQTGGIRKQCMCSVEGLGGEGVGSCIWEALGVLLNWERSLR